MKTIYFTTDYRYGMMTNFGTVVFILLFSSVIDGRLFVHRVTQLCLVPKRLENAQNKDRLGLYACDGGSKQQWTVNNDGTIVNMNNTKCLDSDFNDVYQNDCNGGAYQKFSMTALVNENVIQNVRTGNYLQIKKKRRNSYVNAFKTKDSDCIWDANTAAAKK